MPADGPDNSWMRAVGIVGLPGLVMVLCIAAGTGIAALLADNRAWMVAGGMAGALVGAATVYSVIRKLLR
ncbi:MAG: hypothetical protein JW909_08325 [Planctomycetes bacterium]|nr:hypothetical protein [Planctomycetota bacterium]